MSLTRAQISKVIRDGVPPGIAHACIDLLMHAVDDDAGYLLVAGASLLVEPFVYLKPVIPLPAMHGPMPHPQEIAAFVRRHSTARGNLTTPAKDAVQIWRSCPAALTCRAEVRHAIRTLCVHMTMPEMREYQPNSVNRELKAVCIASVGCLLNPVEEIII